MADPSNSDRSLLDRLNALKPTSVTLDTSQNVLNRLTSESQPVLRADALSARLRTLRNRPQGGADSPKPAPPRANSPHTAGTPPLKSGVVTSSHRSSSVALLGGDEEDEDDPLSMEDEKALHAFLEDLAEDEDQWDIHAGDGLGDAEEKKVAALLESLGKGGTPAPAKGDQNDRQENADSDDSDGEEMSRQVETVLSQVQDEAELGRKSTQDRRQESPAAPERRTAEEQPDNRQTQESAEADGARPEAQQSEKAKDKQDEGNAEEKDESSNNPFTLPTVPTALVDPTPEPEDSFESDITARMAALKGPGKSINTDSFGLPSAPTFHPEDRPVAGVFKKVGYTDEDQKTWCIVCLEDATIRCVGCDDDVYCARCWREMHVGPAAGFDERGHKWVKFVK